MESLISESGKYMLWSASVNGAEAEGKIFDLRTLEEVDHVHYWTDPVWHWSDESASYNGTYISFTCLNGTGTKETKIVSDNAANADGEIVTVSYNTINT